MNPSRKVAVQNLSDRLSGQDFSWLRELRVKLPDSEWFVVGGAVRDAYLERYGDADVDFVVRNVSLADLVGSLSGYGSADLVGRSFGVVKSGPFDTGIEYDIALPRTERAGMSGGYRDFSVQADPSLTIASDLARRDYTVNAMAYDIAKQDVIDPFGGESDLEANLLRAVGDPRQRFAEDVSRALRGVRFACQLGFNIEESTWREALRVLPKIESEREDGERLVAKEVIAKEVVKAFAAGPRHAAELFDESGLLKLLLPELALLKGCDQSNEYHSEGDVWTHTLMSLEALESSSFRDAFPGSSHDVVTAIAVLFHDVGKPSTREVIGERTTFHGHAESGARIARAACERLNLASGGVSPSEIEWLVHMHLLPATVDLKTVRKTTIERHFCHDVIQGERLLHLAYVDALSSVHPDGTTDVSFLGPLQDMIGAMLSSGHAPKSLVTGDDVMQVAGISPGPEVGDLLEKVREAQLSGEISTDAEAKEFLRKIA